MLNKGAFALEIVRGDPELTADCRVTLNRGDRIGSLDCTHSRKIYIKKKYIINSKLVQRTYYKTERKQHFITHCIITIKNTKFIETHKNR